MIQSFRLKDTAKQRVKLAILTLLLDLTSHEAVLIQECILNSVVWLAGHWSVRLKVTGSMPARGRRQCWESKHFLYVRITLKTNTSHLPCTNPHTCRLGAPPRQRKFYENVLRSLAHRLKISFSLYCVSYRKSILTTAFVLYSIRKA